ncbi:hypothetical protein ABZW03_18530 [Kitasatospora sp. NPDC004799]|uniref:hypothetical protein n=1 Tax=Kitasatospora sp. NPDC004799 TaxID=3154460 RepID=UPI00339F73A5
MRKPPNQFNISASHGGFVGGFNIDSSGATAQVGGSNTTGAQNAEYHRIAEALRSDSESSIGAESHIARSYAEDLIEAADSRDQVRVDRLLTRIRELISSASSAFTLTRGIMDWME